MIRRRALLAVVAVTVVALGMFLFGYPTRTYLDQRAQLTHEQATVARLADQNASLRSEATNLQNTTEIERLARQNYGLVQPGQEAYAILPAPKTTPTPAGDGQSPAGHRSSAAPAPAGVWSRFVRQLEFWN